MALTRDFKITILERVQSDPKFANALLDEAVQSFLNGDPDTAKIILRDLINATFGFEELAKQINKSDKSVHRMLSTAGNPTMENLSAIFAIIQKKLKVDICAQTKKHH